MFCQKCGNEMKEDDQFCKGCGNPVNSVSQEATQGGQNGVEMKPASGVVASGSKNKTVPILIAMIVVVIVAAVAIIFILLSKNNKKEDVKKETTKEVADVDNPSTGYDGEVYENLNVAIPFYKVLDAAPIIDSRILKGEYSSSYDRWVFDAKFEKDFGEPNNKNDYFYWLYEAKNELYTGVFVEIQCDAVMGMHVELQIDSGIENPPYSSIRIAPDGGSPALLSALFADNVITADQLEDDYSSMTYSEVMSKLGSIGLCRIFFFLNNGGSIYVMWYCPEENKVLSIDFDVATEEVESVDIIDVTPAEKKEMSDDEAFDRFWNSSDHTMVGD